MFDRRLSDQDLAMRNMTAELHRVVSEGGSQRVLLSLLRRIDERLDRIEADISDLKRLHGDSRC